MIIPIITLLAYAGITNATLPTVCSGYTLCKIQTSLLQSCALQSCTSFQRDSCLGELLGYCNSGTWFFCRKDVTDLAVWQGAPSCWNTSVTIRKMLGNIRQHVLLQKLYVLVLVLPPLHSFVRWGSTSRWHRLWYTGRTLFFWEISGPLKIKETLHG